MTDPREVWKANAPALATWAMAHLVNRDDRHGAYGDSGPFTAPAAGPKANALNVDVLARHFATIERRDIVGVHALGADGFGKWVGWDIDAHDGDEKADPAANEKYAKILHAKLFDLAFLPLMYSSNGKGGFHVWVFFDSPVPGPLLYSFARWAVADAAAFGVTVEANPKQPSLSEGRKYGSWLRVPGRHHKQDFWPVAWDIDGWMTPEQTIEYILSLGGCLWECIPEAAYPEPEPEPHREQARREYRDGGESPWEHFNKKADFAGMLKADGAIVGKTKAVTRPGKDSGTSATLGFKNDRESGCPLLFNWSDKWYGIPVGKFLTPFDFEVFKRHGKITADTNRMTIEALRAEGKIPAAPTRKASAPKTNGVHQEDGARAPLIRFEPPTDGEEWTNPHRVARTFNANYKTPDGKPTLVQWRCDYHSWNGSAWSPIPEPDLKAAVARHARQLFEADLPARVAASPDKPPKLPAVTGRVQSDTLVNLAGLVNMPDTGEDVPFWIGDRRGQPDPSEVLAAPNGLFTLEDVAAGRPAFSPPTPYFFTPNALTFPVPPLAVPQPKQWLQVLDQWFAGDRPSIDALQEWAGYLLSANTSCHKILMLVGPARSGKGTILRVLTALVGAGNVASTSFARLGESFGLESLIGKRVAIIPDGRLSGRTDAAAVVERLLSVSGEDAQSINRKNKAVLTANLKVRFVIGSNEVPRLPDASGAVASRFDILRTPNSWLGREDRGLTDRLMTELPGILLWAAKGWVRLKANGLRFTTTTAAADYVRQLEDLSSPIKAFIRERCSVGPEYTVDVHELYTAWKSWNDEQNRDISAQNIFGRDLKAAVPQVRVCNQRRGEGRVRVYAGIALREMAHWGEETNEVERNGTRSNLTQRVCSGEESKEERCNRCVSSERVPLRSSDIGEEVPW